MSGVRRCSLLESQHSTDEKKLLTTVNHCDHDQPQLVSLHEKLWTQHNVSQRRVLRVKEADSHLGIFTLTQPFYPLTTIIKSL